jgi:hypothetical protein
MVAGWPLIFIALVQGASWNSMHKLKASASWSTFKR